MNRNLIQMKAGFGEFLAALTFRPIYLIMFAVYLHRLRAKNYFTRFGQALFA